MTGEIKLYIGLLALGLLLIGAGLWLRFNSAPAIDIPEGPPVITANASYIMRGEFSFLSIYEDGSIIYIEEKGLRMPTWRHPPTRTWKTGRLQAEELNSLIGLFKSWEFGELDKYYHVPRGA